MKNIILFAAVLLLTSTYVHAQKKKDLLAEIDKLRSELRTTQGQLADSKKKEASCETRVKTMEVQITDLKETNGTLLSNMSNFTELSNKKASNLQKSQEIIKEKDKQLNVINDAITSGDSIKLTVYSKFKNAIGGDNLKIKEGSIFINVPNSTLFGDNDKSYQVSDGAKPMLEKIASVLKTEPNLNVIIEGNSNALKLDGKNVIDNWDLSARQAAAVVRVLQNDYEIDPKRLQAIGKSEYSTEGIETVTRIRIDPGFDQFYGLVKGTMKNAD